MAKLYVEHTLAEPVSDWVGLRSKSDNHMQSLAA
jgi:hypothetical protein